MDDADTAVKGFHAANIFGIGQQDFLVIRTGDDVGREIERVAVEFFVRGLGENVHGGRCGRPRGAGSCCKYLEVGIALGKSHLEFCRIVSY